ncbi:phage late control D family protein [Actinoplanes solisilvae]|uniref:phage late control D family protein n=1 Tax=Actinoplanes solisilvae TaxID=2486853 RepID=UPI000FD8EEF3|nr:phage late control D family protein [Actinoplanes solisilvae]
MTEPALAATSPVFTVDGQLVRDLGRDCVRLEVSEGVEGLRTLQAHFLATGAGATGPPGRGLHLDGRTVDLAKTIKVSIGPDTEQRFVFDGVVSAVEAVLDDPQPLVVVVHAEDALMRLRMSRGLRTFADVTDGAMAQEIATAHHLDADVFGGGPTYDLVQQLNQSDLAFLRERARLIQAEIWCTGRTLHFQPRTERDAPSLILSYPADVISLRLCADLSHQRHEVRVCGFSARGDEIIDAGAGREVIEAEVSGGRNGPALVKDALGPSVTFRIREVPHTTAQAEAWAKAEMLRRARQFVTATGVTRGTADMVVGSRLRLESVGPSFDGGGYYVTRVTHTFDVVSGFRTHFDAERPIVNEVS